MSLKDTEDSSSTSPAAVPSPKKRQKTMMLLEKSALIKDNPPRHCPDCHTAGQVSKVKVYRINDSNEGVIMCEKPTCKWPFHRHDSDSWLVNNARERQPARKHKKATLLFNKNKDGGEEEGANKKKS